MVRLDATLWAMGTAGLTAIEPDPSFLGFIRNASVIGSVIGAGWLVEARIGKKIGTAIKAHTDVEDEWRRGLEQMIAREFGHVNDRLDDMKERPCQTCRTPVPR